jgi:hypothetical protein
MAKENIIEKGKQFPPQSEMGRISKQIQWDKMYLGEHVFNKITTSDGTQKDIDPTVPLPQVISDISADLLFGERPLFLMDNPSNQEKIDEWLEDNKEYFTDLLEGANGTSSMGMLFWYLFKMDGKIFYKYIKPQNVIWEKDVLGITKAWIYKLTEVADNKKSAIYHVLELSFKYDEEQYKSPLSDENRRFVTRDLTIKVEIPNGTGTGSRKITDIKENEIVKTEWDFMPLIEIDNQRQLGYDIGRSDYQGKEQLFAEIDNRVDQNNYVLEEHADPWLFVPPGVLNNKGKFDKSQGKMVEKMSAGQGDNSVDIISWDANLSNSFKQIEMQIQLVLFTARISNSIAGFFFDRSGGQAESGRAIKQKSVNTNSMIERKRKYWGEGIQKFFEYYNIMSDDLELDEGFKMTIKWQDGLPLDKNEIVEGAVKEVNTKLKSRLTAIQEINEVDKEQAEKEQAQIQEEQQAQATIESSKFAVNIE